LIFHGKELIKLQIFHNNKKIKEKKWKTIIK
jgi:hypothetical protein